MTVIFRAGGIQDCSLIYGYLRGLAIHEGTLASFKLTEEGLHDVLQSSSAIHILIAEEDGVPIGLAMWSERFSAFSGGINMWLLELYVTDDYRGRGVGKKFFSELKSLAIERGYKRIEWFISIENETAKEFYRKMGGQKTTHTERWKIEL